MIYVFLFILGTILGSFYNVVIYRLPKGKSIIVPSSHCPSCGYPIRWYDNIPIISFILLKGKCRKCKSKISLIYPFVEFSSGVLLVMCFIRWDHITEAIVMYIFFSMLLILSVIDWQTFTLPDIINYTGIVFGVASSFIREGFSLYDSILGLVFGFTLPFLIYLYYVKIRKMEGLGLGDVKLLCFIGAVSGMYGVLSAVTIGSLLGLLYAVPFILKYRNLKFVVPFGPFLSLGCFIGLTFENYIGWIWKGMT